MINLNNFKTVQLVESNIYHKRYVKPYNSFNYNCISILVNLNRINANIKISPLFSVNRKNFFSWHEKDHGNGKEPLIDWARKEIKKYGGDASGDILLHCFPKILGHVFNPLSVYFCFDKKQKLSALIYEVRNVVGGIHSFESLNSNHLER